MNTAFDMPTEVANLAERIVGPVAAKFTQNGLDTALGRHFRELKLLMSCSLGASRCESRCIVRHRRHPTCR